MYHMIWGPFGIAIHMLHREKVDMWAWLSVDPACVYANANYQ